jgi:hypothetical protein
VVILRKLAAILVADVVGYSRLTGPTRRARKTLFDAASFRSFISSDSQGF